MPTNMFTCPTSGRTFCMGRVQPPPDSPKLKFGDYATRGLSFKPPASCDYSAAAMESLRKVYVNDQLGDCVVAGQGHVEGIITANGITPGKPRLFTNDQIIAQYSAIGGYRPGWPSTDNGCNEIEALNYWAQKGGPDGHRISGWMTVDGSNAEECKSALWQFGNLYFGIQMPTAWVNPFPQGDGFTWGVAGPHNPGYGHCFCAGAYNDHGTQICTWGMQGTLTWDAIAKYCNDSAGGELYTVVSPDILNALTKRAPDGLDWARLIADFDAMGGKVPQPDEEPISWFL